MQRQVDPADRLADLRRRLRAFPARRSTVQHPRIYSRPSASARHSGDLCCADGGGSLSKRHDKQRRRTRRSFESAEVIELHGAKFQAERHPAPLLPLNTAQAAYLDALKSSDQIAVLGPAGTGKTWMAATYAADLYRQGRISKIILTRPNVPAGRSLGFFPGSLSEKFGPWAAPIIDAIADRIGRAAHEIAVKNGDIELVPFEVMRGRSWREAFISPRRGSECDRLGDEDVPHTRWRGLHGRDQRRCEPMRPQRRVRPADCASTH